MPSHILIVDDEAPIREMLNELLGRAGFRVSAAASVQEALRILEEDPPRLVITDLQLEDSDGFELTERVKANLPDVPVLLLTGILFDREALHASTGDKIAGYVEKTAPLSKILGEVRRLIGDGG